MKELFKGKMMFRQSRIILLIFSFVFITRAFFCFVFAGDDRHFLEPDSSSYISPAQALLHNGAFLAAPDKWSEPETLRTPGYPLWLALNFSIFGKKLYWVVLGQIFLFLVTLYLTALMAEKLFGAKAVLPAVFLLSLDPASFATNLKILTESLATLFTMIFAYSLTLYFQCKDKKKHALGAGFSLATLTLIRPTTYYFPLILAILLLMFYSRRNIGWKTGLLQLLLMFLPFLLLIGSWQARNYRSAGIFVFTTVQGNGLLSSKIGQIISVKEGIGAEMAAERMEVDKERSDWATLSAKEQDAWIHQKAVEVMLENPWLALKTHVIQLIDFFFEPGTTSGLFRLFDPDYNNEKFNWYAKGEYFAKMLSDHRLFILSFGLGEVYLILLYALLIGSLYLTSRSQDVDIWPHLALWFFIGYIANVCSLGFAYSRHRVVIMPLLCIYSAGGFSMLLELVRKPIKKP